MGASAARGRQTRTMLEARALVSDADHAVAQLRAHRPSAADGEAGADHRVEEGLPAGAGGAVVAVALRLLEGVVDGDREGWVRLLGEAVHRLRHAVEEECLGLLLAAVAIGRGDQFLGLRHGERGEEVGEDRLQRAAQPDVEEVRQVGVADVVVVGRVGGDNAVKTCHLGSRVLLKRVTPHSVCAHHAFRGVAERILEAPRLRRERVHFGEVPGHRNRLSAEGVSRLGTPSWTASIPSTDRRHTIGQAANHEPQVHPHRLGVGGGTVTAAGEGFAGVSRASGEGVSLHLLARFLHQVGEGRQRHQLAVGEELVEPLHAVGFHTEVLRTAGVHYGLAETRFTAREAVLRKAFEATPKRFVRGLPKPLALPQAVWINKPRTQEDSSVTLDSKF